MMTYAGRTLLHEAAAANRLEECRCLLQLGLSAAAPDRLGITPLDEAEARGFTDIVALLQHCKGVRKTWTSQELTVRSFTLLGHLLMSKCPICYGLLWMPVDAGECGHMFCRSCLQLSRRGTSNRCPVCRAAVTLPSGFVPNVALTHIARTQVPAEWAKTEIEQRANAVEIAIGNLMCLGAALGMGNKLVFNASGSCCLLIDGEFLMHVTLLPTHRLFMYEFLQEYIAHCTLSYAPILQGLPSMQLARLALCERILIGALESDEDVPGSVGILQEQQVIIYHRELDLRDPHTDTLRRTSGSFVTAVKRWRLRVHEVLQMAEGVKRDAVSPASMRRSCRSVFPSPSPSHTRSDDSDSSPDLESVARLAVAKDSIDQFLAESHGSPLSYNVRGDGLLVRFIGLSLRYMPLCDCLLLSAPLLDDSAIIDETLRLRIYEELLSASAFGSNTAPACGAALEHIDGDPTDRLQLVLYGVAPCVTGRLREFISDFNNAVGAWRARLRDMISNSMKVRERDRLSPHVLRHCALQGGRSPLLGRAALAAANSVDAGQVTSVQSGSPP